MQGETVPRFKQFRGSGAKLESDVNAWLADFGPDIVHVVQSLGPDGSITLGFVYDESFLGQERRLDHEHGVERASGPASPEAVMPEDSVTVRITPPEEGPEPNTGLR